MYIFYDYAIQMYVIDRQLTLLRKYGVVLSTVKNSTHQVTTTDIQDVRRRTRGHKKATPSPHPKKRRHYQAPQHTQPPSS